jgi:hypothetical protein
MGKIDWDVVTNYTDVVTTTLKTVTFPKVQEQVYLRNQGNANITYTIGSQSGTLTPGQSVTVNQDVSSYTVQAVSGTHTFELRAKEKGTEIIETDNNLPSDVSGQLTTIASQLADIATNVKTFGAKGDGITDDTTAIQNAINYAIQNKKHVLVPTGNYVISDTLVFNYTSTAYSSFDNGFIFGGDVTTKTVFLAKLNNKPLFHFNTQNFGGAAYGIKIRNFVIKPFDSSYNQKFDGMKLTNCISNIYEGIEVIGCNNGLFLTVNKDTTSNPLNTGYTEQNLFDTMTITGCINCVTYDVGMNDYNSSFHGNQFKNCFMAVNSSGAGGVECSVLRMNSGLIYNNTYDIRMMTTGTNCNLLYINANGNENVGHITYECANPARIKTGNRVNAKFVLSGYLIGLNGTTNVDWSAYSQVQAGDLDNSGVAIDATSPFIGLDRFYSLNLIPPNVTTANIITGKTSKLLSLNPNIQDVWSGIRQHGLYRYKATDFTNESGFIAICRDFQDSGNAKFSVGEQSETNKKENGLAVGFDIYSSGKKIVSRSQSSTLNFNANGIGISGSTVNITTSKTPTSSTDTGIRGDICWDVNYLYVCVSNNFWKRIALTTW